MALSLPMLASHLQAAPTQQLRLLSLLETLLLANLPPLYYGCQTGIVYRCPVCQERWQITPENTLSYVSYAAYDADASVPSRELHPPSLCRPCSREHAGGALEIDQFGQTLVGGYGLNWESDLPRGGHVFFSLVNGSWADQARFQEMGTLLHHPHQARACLRWIAHQRRWEQTRITTPTDAIQMAVSNPPGHGVAGWMWKGCAFRLPASVFDAPSPFGGTVEEHRAVFAVALPPEEALDLDTLLRICQLLALLGSAQPLNDTPLDEPRLRATFRAKAWLFQP